MLSQYIKNAEPSTELYDLFMDYYKLTDYGFKNLNEADIRKVLSGKSEEQKKKTAEKLPEVPGYNYRLSRRGQQINAVYAVFLVDGQLQSSLFLCLQVAER